MNYLQRKKLAFMSIVNQIKGFVRTMVGMPPLVLPDCVGGTSLINYSISGNSVQDGTPSPDNPVEIENVGEKSKNLLKIAGREPGTLTGQATTTIRNFDFNKYYVGFTRTNEYVPTYITYCSVLGSTVAVETKIAYVGVAFPVRVKPNTNYYLSNSNNLFIGTGFYTINGEYIGANHYKNFTTPENCEIITVVCSPTFKDTVVTFENIQLEEGTDATEYEPYGYKIPIKVSGKNLLKIEGRTEGTLEQGNIPIRQFEFDKYYTGWARNNQYYPWYTISHSIKENSVLIEPRVGWYGIGFPMKAKPNTTYYMSNLNKYQMGVGYYTKDGEYIGESAKNLFTTPNNCEIMVISCVPTTTGGTTVYEDIQVEEGTVATDYEPYIESTETSIYLDEPLRKVGDVSDYIDFENGRVVRNVKTEKFNTLVNAISSGSQYATGLCRMQYGIPSREPYNYNATVAPLCTHLQGNKGSIVAKANNITYSEQFAYAYLYLDAINQIGLEPVTSTVSNATISTAIKNYLNQFDIDIYSVMATPIEEPINLPTIPTFKGTMVLSPNTAIQPSNMSATYYSTSKE